MSRRLFIAGWLLALMASVGVRAWNALAGPLMWGYDAWGHVAYVIFLDLYRAIPWADQGWSYFHPPFHYALGWLLAQFGGAEMLVRGLAVWGSIASVATALIGARLVHLAAAEQPQPGLGLLGFGAVAFIPVHLLTSPMPGNEMTQTFLAAAALGVFIANNHRCRPTIVNDAFAGGLLGLAMLTKFNGSIALLVVLATLGLGALRSGGSYSDLRRVALRALILTGVALSIAGPYYARNLVEFGNAFQLSRDFPLVAEVERGQPPGERKWSDYIRLSPHLLSDPNPLAPHLLHSVWGTVYLDAWGDIFRESDVERALISERESLRSTKIMAWIGIFPTLLALVGAGLVIRDLLHGRRETVYIPILLLAAASVATFCVFAWRVPLWSALKASYLLGLSLPYAVFVARSVEALRGREMRVAVLAALTASWVAGSVFALEGVVRPRRADAPATGAVHFYFGEYDEARRIYGRLIAGSRDKAAWLDNLAAVDLAAGNSQRARNHYARAVALGAPDPYRVGRLAVATAMAGDRGGALDLLGDALKGEAIPELLANRAVLLAMEGEIEGAERDFQRALEAAPEMVPAWSNFAELLEATERPARAALLRERARREACRGPRGYPYGVGSGEVLRWAIGERWLLLWEAGVLRVARPAFYREACQRLGAARADLRTSMPTGIR